jgi:23S rRNA (guanosine2251-2'-O)-methyltransferase
MAGFERGGGRGGFRGGRGGSGGSRGGGGGRSFGGGPRSGGGGRFGGGGGVRGGGKFGGGGKRFDRGPRFGGGEGEGGERSGGEGAPKRFGGERGPKRFGGGKRFGDGDRGEKRFGRGGGKFGGGGGKRFDRGGGEGGGKRFGGGGKFQRGPRFGGDEGAPREPRFDARAPREEPRPIAAPPGSRFLYGINPALEALRARPQEIDHLYYADGSLNPNVAGEIFSRARDANIRTEAVPRERLASMAEGGVHQGIVIELREYQYAELDKLLESKGPGLVVVLDGLQDPQNVGAIIRSAHALGASGVVLAKDRAAAITGTVVKASAGATEHTPIARVVNLSRALEELKAKGYWTVAADPEGTPLHETKLDGPLAIVIGAEGEGVRPGVLSHCDFRVRIPMSGQVASLNASVSAGIVLYEIARQRLSTSSVVKP